MGIILQKKFFGERLKNRREQLGYTGQSFSEAIQTSQNYISQMENGYKTPSIEYLLRIANQLECGTDYLFGDSLKVMQPVVLNEIAQEMQGLAPDQIQEIHVVIRAMISYMQAENKIKKRNLDI